MCSNVKNMSYMYIYSSTFIHQFEILIIRRLMRRHGSAQSGSSNISLLDEIAESFHTGVINQGTVSSLPLPVPENDAESALEDDR